MTCRSVISNKTWSLCYSRLGESRKAFRKRHEQSFKESQRSRSLIKETREERGTQQNLMLRGWDWKPGMSVRSYLLFHSLPGTHVLRGNIRRTGRQEGPHGHPDLKTPSEGGTGLQTHTGHG